MITNLKAISNPLTIVAIFAGLAEVVGTVMLGLVDPSIQPIFVWFVMLFPILIVSLFFATLNWNAKVLYAPSDFRDDETFVATVFGAGKIKARIDSIEEGLAKLEQKGAVEVRTPDPVAEQAPEHQGSPPDLPRASTAASAPGEYEKAMFEMLRRELGEVKEYTESLVDPRAIEGERTRRKILRALAEMGSMTSEQISKVVQIHPLTAKAALGLLASRGDVVRSSDGRYAFKG